MDFSNMGYAPAGSHLGAKGASISHRGSLSVESLTVNREPGEHYRVMIPITPVNECMKMTYHLSLMLMLLSEENGEAWRGRFNSGL